MIDQKILSGKQLELIKKLNFFGDKIYLGGGTAPKGMSYFKDAESEDIGRGIRVFDASFSWEKAKEEITDRVRKYQLGMIKK